MSIPARAMAETLEEAWSIALRTDQALEASQWRVYAAQHRYMAARAARWSTADVNTDYRASDKERQRRVDDPLLGPPTAVPFEQREGLTAIVSVKQPLCTFGRIRSGIDAAGAGLTHAQFDYTTAKLGVKLAVAEAYIRVLRAQSDVAVRQSNVERLASHLRDVQNRMDSGLAVKNELLASRVSLSDAKQEWLRAQNQLKTAEAVYNESLGRRLDESVDLADLEMTDDPREFETLAQQAVANRPEIAALAAAVRDLRRQAESILASGRPQITCYGSLEFIENRFLASDVYSNVGVVGEWNLFDFGQKRNQAKELMSQAEAVLRQRADLEAAIVLEVRQAWLEKQTSQERLEVAREALGSADENVRVTQDRYRRGVGTNTDVLDAETLRTRAHANLSESRYDTVMALIVLQFAIGDVPIAGEDVYDRMNQ